MPVTEQYNGHYAISSNSVQHCLYAKGIKMVVGSGLRRECGDVVYIFSTEKDAELFATCVNGGGLPGHCAELHNCVGKETPDRSKELGR